jgi:hypothetical protein
MPNVHKHPAITPRPAPELKQRADKAVADLGMTLNAWVIASLEYLVGDRSEPPPRPEHE